VHYLAQIILLLSIGLGVYSKRISVRSAKLRVYKPSTLGNKQIMGGTPSSNAGVTKSGLSVREVYSKAFSIEDDPEIIFAELRKIIEGNVSTCWTPSLRGYCLLLAGRLENHLQGQRLKSNLSSRRAQLYTFAAIYFKALAEEKSDKPSRATELMKLASSKLSQVHESYVFRKLNLDGLNNREDLTSRIQNLSIYTARIAYARRVQVQQLSSFLQEVETYLENSNGENGSVSLHKLRSYEDVFRKLTKIGSSRSLAKRAAYIRLNLCAQIISHSSENNSESDVYLSICLHVASILADLNDWLESWEVDEFVLSPDHVPQHSVNVAEFEMISYRLAPFLSIAQLNSALRHTSNWVVYSQICLMLARKHLHAMVEIREIQGEIGKILQHAEHGLMLLRQIEVDSSLSTIREELQIDIDTNLEFARGHSALDNATRALNTALFDSEELNVELIWDAIDQFRNVPEHTFELHPAVAGNIAIAFRALGIFEKAHKNAYAATQLAQACAPRTFNHETWYQECLKILEERDRRNREQEAEEARKQAKLDEPILKELQPQLEAIEKAARASWSDLIRHIYEHHPVPNRKQPEDLSTESWKVALRAALLAYHPDKVPPNSPRKVQLLHNNITRHLTEKYNKLKDLD